jgi:hypothetical protein
MAYNLDYIKEIIGIKQDPLECQTQLDIEAAIQKIEQAGYRYEFEERAAILEYDGGLCRQDAEQQATDEIIERYRI